MADLAMAPGSQGALARLACMPADTESARERLKAQVRNAWNALSNAGAPILFGRAIAAATPILPCLQHPQPDDLDDLLDDLEEVLAQHHPAEICVVSFTLLSGLLEAVREERGEAVVRALLAALAPS